MSTEIALTKDETDRLSRRRRRIVEASKEQAEFEQRVAAQREFLKSATDKAVGAFDAVVEFVLENHSVPLAEAQLSYDEPSDTWSAIHQAPEQPAAEQPAPPAEPKLEVVEDPPKEA